MKNKIYIIIILILSLFFTIGCEKQKNEAKKVEVEVEQLSNSDKEILLKIVAELKYMDYYGKNILPRNLTNQEALRISYEILKSRDNIDNLYFDDLENIAISYLGFGLEPENLLCDTHFVLSSGTNSDILIYNTNTKKYEKNNQHINHVDNGIRTDVYNNFVSGTKNGNEYVITVNKIFSGLLGHSYDASSTYYVSYKDSVSYENVLFSGGKVNESTFTKYKDKLLEYSYKFRYVDGNYVLSSYTIIQ